MVVVLLEIAGKKSTGNDKVILTWNVLKIRGKNEVYIKYLVQFIGWKLIKIKVMWQFSFFNQ